MEYPIVLFYKVQLDILKAILICPQFMIIHSVNCEVLQADPCAETQGLFHLLVCQLRSKTCTDNDIFLVNNKAKNFDLDTEQKNILSLTLQEYYYYCGPLTSISCLEDKRLTGESDLQHNDAILLSG